MHIPAPVLASPADRTAPARSRIKQGILITYPDLNVLWRRQADQLMAPSSMTKLMTALLVFDALDAGKIKPSDFVTITRAAARQRGSRLRLKAGQKVRLSVLLEGMIVFSANDAAAALAIHMAGSERAFARQMTRRAQLMGLRRASFANATGFSAKNHVMSARNIALLSAYLLSIHEKFMPLFGKTQFRFAGRIYRNRNPILRMVGGADGFKTGQTRAGGYGLAATARRGDKRLILIINGLPSASARAQDAKALLEWGFTHYPPSR